MSTYLLQQQLPINSHSRLPILPAILSQPRTNIAHSLQAIPSVQQILDVLRHNLGHIFQFIIQLIEILRGTRVLICLSCALNKRVKLDEGVGPA